MECKWQKCSYSTVVMLGVLLCVCSTLGGFVTVEGQSPVWSDNFNDGTYAPEWTVLRGEFSATNNQLDSLGSSDIINWVSHASSVAEGEWRFDLYTRGDANIRVSFIALDTDSFGTTDQRPNDGYCLRFSSLDEYIRLDRHSGGSATLLDGYSDTNVANVLFQVIVTRDSAGNFNVWVNGVHRMEAQSTHHSTSLYFLFQAQNGYIDNIEVYDEILTHDDGTDGTPPPIPGFPAVAIALGVVSALTIGVLYRRRQSPTKSK